MKRLPEHVGGIQLRDREGQAHELRALWREQTGVIGFLRHFGCVFCQEQARALHGAQGDVRARGAEVHLVGTGTPEQGTIFARGLGLSCPVWVDPALATFRALGMKRGFWPSLGSPSTWKAMLRASRLGLRQGPTQGDVWQLGGVLVVRPDGVVAYRYLSAFAGDHPKTTAILAALA